MPTRASTGRNGAGYVSKLEVQSDGTLKIVEEKLITGLTAPLGFAVIPTATKKFPKGTIFLVQATAPLVEADGTPVKDSAERRTPKITAFNVDGKVLGEIKPGRGFRRRKGRGRDRHTGQRAGLRQVGQSVRRGNRHRRRFVRSRRSPPRAAASICSRTASLDDLADGKDAKVSYLPVPEGGPDGIEVGPDGAIHFNTVGVAAGLKDPAEGGQYKVSKKDIESGKLPAPFGKGFGALDGLDFAGKVRLDTEIKNTSSVIVTTRRARPIR